MLMNVCSSVRPSDCLGGGEDALVGLMGDDAAQVADGQAGLGEGFMGGLGHAANRQLEDFVAAHADEVGLIGDRFRRGGAGRAAGFDGEHLFDIAARAEHGARERRSSCVVASRTTAAAPSPKRMQVVRSSQLVNRLKVSPATTRTRFAPPAWMNWLAVASA